MVTGVPAAHADDTDTTPPPATIIAPVENQPIPAGVEPVAGTGLRNSEGRDRPTARPTAPKLGDAQSRVNFPCRPGTCPVRIGTEWPHAGVVLQFGSDAQVEVVMGMAHQPLSWPAASPVAAVTGGAARRSPAPAAEYLPPGVLPPGPKAASS